jgi:hypothetical protein
VEELLAKSSSVDSFWSKACQCKSEKILIEPCWPGIVENKRLGEVLAWIKEKQDSQSRFNRIPDGPRRSSQKPRILKSRALQFAEAAKSRQKAHRIGRRRSDMVVSAAPANAPSEAAE